MTKKIKGNKESKDNIYRWFDIRQIRPSLEKSPTFSFYCLIDLHYKYVIFDYNQIKLDYNQTRL